eukprot:gene14478-475_t
MRRAHGDEALRTVQLPQPLYRLEVANVTNSNVTTGLAELFRWQGDGAPPPSVLLPGLYAQFVLSRSTKTEPLKQPP